MSTEPDLVRTSTRWACSMVMLPLTVTTLTAPTGPSRITFPDTVPITRSVPAGQRTMTSAPEWPPFARMPPSGSGSSLAPCTTRVGSGSATTRTALLRLEMCKRSELADPSTGPILRSQQRRQFLGVRDREVLHRSGQGDEQQTHAVRSRRQDLVGLD